MAFLRATPTATRSLFFPLLNVVLLSKEQYLPILSGLGLMRPVRVGLEPTNSRMLSESTTTTLPQPVS
jgi:hypothetical protein